MPIPSQATRINSEKPRVAVIIPCHNHSDYIQNAMRSVAEQDYENIMMGIVDDGSTDNSFEAITSVVKDLQSAETPLDDEVYTCKYEDIPVILVRRENAKKQAAARNIAIQLAWPHVELFSMLDADDLYHAQKISKSIKVWQTNPKFIGIVYSDVIIHDVRDNTFIHEFRPPYDRKLLEKENIISNGPLISKLALEYSGLYDIELPPCEDWDLWLRITENFVAMHIPEPLQQYTVSGQNCTFTVPNEIWQQQWLRVQEKLAERKRVLHGQQS